MGCVANSVLQARIVTLTALITAYEAALLALGTVGIQSYTLDTGQTRQTVTRANVTELRRAVSSFYNDLATTEARLNGCGVTHGSMGG